MSPFVFPTYDNANELTHVDKNGTQVESYSYDLNGNRTATGYSTTVMNETATSPGVTYTYDNAGNMISANNGTAITTYTYDFHNRLTEVTQGGTVIATYVYDDLGRRIGVDDNSTETWTVYDGTNPYADFNGSGTLQVRYQYGPGVVDGAVVDQLLARTNSGGTTAWYLPDKLGSVRDIVSTSGTELDHIVYDSFGNIVTETNAANGDRFKYAGMQYDSLIGQYNDDARSFDSVTGAFTSLDPLSFGGGQLNLYAYVNGDPTDSVDPTGTQQTTSTSGPQQPNGGAGAGAGQLPGAGQTSQPGTGNGLQGGSTPTKSKSTTGIPPAPPMPGLGGRSNNGIPPAPPIPKGTRSRSRGKTVIIIIVPNGSASKPQTSGPGVARRPQSTSKGVQGEKGAIDPAGSQSQMPQAAYRVADGQTNFSQPGKSTFAGGNPRTPARSAFAQPRAPSEGAPSSASTNNAEIQAEQAFANGKITGSVSTGAGTGPRP